MSEFDSPEPEEGQHFRSPVQFEVVGEGPTPIPERDARKERLQREVEHIKEGLYNYGHALIVDQSGHPSNSGAASTSFERRQAMQSWATAVHCLREIELDDDLDALIFVPRDEIEAFSIDQRFIGNNVFSYYGRVDAEVPMRMFANADCQRIVRMNERVRRELPSPASPVNALTNFTVGLPPHTFVCMDQGREEPFYVHVDDIAIAVRSGADFELR